MRRKAVFPLMMLLAAAAGCGGGDGTAAAPAASGAPTTPVAGSAAASGQSTGPAPSASAGGGGDVTNRCRHGGITFKVQDAPGGGAAGSQYLWIVLTNPSSRACTLYGYPGVSWVTGDGGQQVNQPAERDTGVEPKQVKLESGQSAHVQVRSPQPGNFGDACKPVDVRGYRVYLPDETAADFVPSPQRVCSADGVGRAQVGPVVAGLSQ
ncbi:DUF4232 domain-containing protein [Dactylosporangium vinaceum]|uniref:DUF4232 domain-containing protein n=1 Tax=Dactylosporangium vinaceum TaxID=53362 RepID=A0ABV5MKI2_9ACTN|nr:DUF4232 domain-containing protein [Dactylosporangium vinaceum]UAB94159.1 DUF4232 domain-containing protein [Dactylosporangium vinaceum]